MIPVMDAAASRLICISWRQSRAEALQIANQSWPRGLTAILSGCLHGAHSHLWDAACAAVIAPNQAEYLHLLWFGKGHCWQRGPRGHRVETDTLYSDRKQYFYSLCCPCFVSKSYNLRHPVSFTFILCFQIQYDLFKAYPYVSLLFIIYSLYTLESSSLSAFSLGQLLLFTQPLTSKSSNFCQNKDSQRFLFFKFTKVP